MSATTEDLLTVEEVAALVGIKPLTLKAHREKGLGPPLHDRHGPGGRLYFRRVDVLEWDATRRKTRRMPPNPAAAQSAENGSLGKMLDTQQAAALLRIDPGDLAAARRRGGGPEYLKLGARILYREADLLAWLREGNVE